MSRRKNDDRVKARESIAAKVVKARAKKDQRSLVKARAVQKVKARNKPATPSSTAPASNASAPAPAANVLATGADALKEREYEITRLVALCLPHVEIVRRMRRKYGLEGGWVQEVIKNVYATWEARSNSTGKDTRREQMRNTLGLLLDRALSIMDVKTAVVAADRLSKLDGLYAPEKVELSNGTVAETEPDRVRDRMRALVEKHADKLGIRLPPTLRAAVDEAAAKVDTATPTTVVDVKAATN
jgi:hypothetical protein